MSGNLESCVPAALCFRTPQDRIEKTNLDGSRFGVVSESSKQTSWELILSSVRGLLFIFLLLDELGSTANNPKL